ncbi:uncharacterized peroxidase-related enzyme [Ferrithrix thermotolerans DSM 19514]|jgi:uncharacterized peroxidase-related enzyme|uniref:Uncharacterized peroxidase-related enzyme n=1 Tax=Ferrithrix thermotolerans DSM 19514 TaxID=1121881 RepID=A0A1M4S5P5_9ACTN|nr:peroxidase-related enzyme [Ferrithrix thermotolerans]SHE27500.1 uncharacterized peroxidase-related enzyme [Ferrithrix thermotolerans DSM 19514]
MTKVPYWFGSLPTIDEVADEDVKDTVVKVTERSGFTPNVFLALARRPEEFRAFFRYHDALLNAEGSLSKAEKEMIIVSTSAANNCMYCVVAHGAILRVRSKDSIISDQLAVDFEKADITARERVMLRFAHKVSLHANEVVPDDFEPLYEHGFSDDDIWVIGSLAAFFALSNRLAGFSNLLPNREFYAMGR